jgi:hypothetical protein
MVNQISCSSNSSNSTMQRLTSDAVIEVLDKVVFACGAVFYNDFNIGHGHICKTNINFKLVVFHSRLASWFLLQLEPFQLKR